MMTEEIEEVEVEILPNNECKDLVFTGEIVDEDPMDFNNLNRFAIWGAINEEQE